MYQSINKKPNQQQPQPQQQQRQQSYNNQNFNNNNNNSSIRQPDANSFEQMDEYYTVKNNFERCSYQFIHSFILL